MFKSLRGKKKSAPSEELSSTGEEQHTKSSKKLGKIIPSTSLSTKTAIEATSNTLGTVKSSLNSSLSKKFNLYQISHYGLEGCITKMCYDQTQSLLAVVTNLNELVIYGTSQVEAHIELTCLVDTNSREPNDVSRVFVKDLMFVKGIYLLVIDSRSTVHVISVLSNKLLTSFYAPGKITATECDPTSNWLIIGLEDGTVHFYDVDKDTASLVVIPNIQRQDFFKSAHISPVRSIAWNPRTIGQVLISFNYVTVLYNILEGKYKMEYVYKLDPGCPGGGYHPKNQANEKKDINTVRYPTVIKSLFHPNGLHIVTLHEDNSMVFWDLNTGKLILARSLYDTKINKEGTKLSVSSADSDFPIAPIIDMRWISAESSEYTQLLILGGDLGRETPHSFTIIDLGGTPLYSVSSYDKMKSYYNIRNNQKILNLSPGKSLVQVLPIPRSSPFYNGNHNPGILIILYDDGELDTMIYPSGKLTFKSSLLPQSLSWLRPFSNISTGSSVPSKTWIGMMHSTYNKDSLLKGGKTKFTTTRQLDGMRTAIITGHVNGSVRLWDGSHSELAETSVFDINVSTMLNLPNMTADINQISYAQYVSELAVAIRETGDVLLLKFDTNKYFNDPLSADFQRFNISQVSTQKKSLLVDVRSRAPKNLRDGFMPQTVIHASAGEVSCLKHSNIGFVAIGYSNGSLMVVDKRGPAVIFFYNIKNILAETGIRAVNGEIVTSAEFGIMQVGADSYSSIVLSCGTSNGNLLQFRVAPGVSGRFSVDLIQALNILDSSVSNIFYVQDGDTSEQTRSLKDTPPLFGNLAKGVIYKGKLIAVSHEGEIVSLSSIGTENKKSSKNYKQQKIASSNIVNVKFTNSKHELKQTAVLVSLLMDRTIVINNCIDLKEVKHFKLHINMTVKNLYNSKVLENGDIILRTGHTMAYVYSVIEGLHTNKTKINDQLYQIGLRIPVRPYYNSLQWARGEQYVYPADLDNILGGINYSKTKSKYKESDIANDSLTKKGEEQPRKISTGKFDLENHSYVPPQRGAAKQGYSYTKAVTKAVENGYDDFETKINDYATQTGKALSDSMEKGSMELSKGLFKSTFGL